MVGCIHELSLFSEIYGFSGTDGFVGASASYFYEDDSIIVTCDDVDLSVPAAIVGFEDSATSADKFSGCEFFGAFA
jgi:hypothetical protein